MGRVSEQARFINDYTCLQHFNSTVLLKCLRCHQCAELIPEVSPKPSKFLSVQRRVSCRHCGYTSSYRSSTLDMACATGDWHRRLPLWLQVPCCGHVLWAFNEQHLLFLESFIGANLRERARESRHSNHSMTSRLPKWMQDAKHRDEIQRGLGRLRQQLSSTNRHSRSNRI